MSLLPRLLETFHLKQTDETSFIGENLDIGSPQIYGGHVLAQAVIAAHRTIQGDRNIHSLHSYFLHPGDNKKAIRYEVEVVKDGRSFNVRRVRAKQGKRTIFILATSFHIDEPSVEHQSSMPNVMSPDKLNSFPEIFEEFAEKSNIKPRGIFSSSSPILFHPVEHYNAIDPVKRPARNHTWFKPNGSFPKDKLTSLALLTYASDFNLLITALLPHGLSLFSSPMRIASLDHAMWFHRPIILDDWLLYSVDSPNLSNSLGYCQGKIYSSDGSLLISIAQEGLIRRT